jgi:hypothetical protein
MSFGQTVYRLRAGMIPDPYNPERQIPGDWDNPSVLAIPRAFIAQTSTAMLGDATRAQALEAKSLFCEGKFDIQKGDRIRDGANEDDPTYDIDGIPPIPDVNPYTHRVARREIPLTRYIG